MNDQNQQQPGATQSGQTQTSSNQANNGLANAQDGPFNPWVGTPEDGEATGGVSGEQQGQTAAATTNTGEATQGQQGQAAAGAATAQPPAVQGLTPEAIRELVASTTAAAVQATRPQPEQPKFTEQDFVKTFQVFQPTAELMARIGLPATPETVKSFQEEIVTPIVRQAVTMAAFQIEKLKADLLGHVKETIAPFEPARQMAAERMANQMKEEFLAQNEDLKGYEPLLVEIRDRLVSQGTKFKTKEEAFKAVAEQARGIIKQIPGLAGQNGQQQQQQQSTNTTNGAATHRMSGLSGSGQGGVGTGGKGGAGGSNKKKSQAEQLFG